MKPNAILTACALMLPLLFNAACSNNGSKVPAINETPAEPGQQQGSGQEPQLGQSQTPTTDQVDPPATPVSDASCDAPAADIQSALLGLINEARATARSCGSENFAAASAFHWNTQLTQAAATHSADMAQVNFFSHTGSDGMSVADRITATGYPWSTVGENIAGGQPTASAAVQAWLDSPGHCSNLMRPDYKEIGAACVSSSTTNLGSYWTLVFGATR